MLICSQNVTALDKGHFNTLTPEDFEEYVVNAFQNVKIYYPVTDIGGSLITDFETIPDLSPKLEGDIKYGVIMFFNPEECRYFINTTEELKGGKVKSTDAAIIIREMFKHRNAPSPNNIKKPEFIILTDWIKRLPVYEYLILNDSNKINYVTIKDYKVIPAFINRNKAMNYQKEMQKKGLELKRVGLGEKSFVELMVTKGKEGYFTLLEGF